MVQRILTPNERLVQCGVIGRRQYPGGPVISTEPIYIVEKVENLTEHGLTPRMEKNYDELMRDLCEPLHEYVKATGFKV